MQAGEEVLRGILILPKSPFFLIRIKPEVIVIIQFVLIAGILVDGG